MAVVLHASTPVGVYGDTETNTSLTTASFTPPSGSVVVAKVVSADSTQTHTTPTGLTFTSRVVSSGASSTRVSIFTATGGGSAITVTAAFAGTAQVRSLNVEVWTGAQLAGSPATNAVGPSSPTPTSTITTVAAGSVVTWVNGDWAAIDGASRAYRSSATEVAYHRVVGMSTAYFAYQAAAVAGSQTYGLTAPSGQTYTMAAIEIQSAATPIPVSFGATGAWIAPASSVTVTPVYPADDNLDLIVAVLCIKPNTATVATPASWTAGPVQAVGGGTQGAGAGAVQARLFTRVSNGALSGGSQAFTITSGSSPVGHMKAWKYNAAGFTAPQWEPVTSTFYSRTTASTTFGGTGAANLSLAAGDVLLYVSLSADDQSTTHTINTLTAAGCTLATRVQSPAGSIINAQGNDISAACAYALVTAGASTGPPVATVTGNSSETGGGIFYRIRATGTPAGAAPGPAWHDQARMRAATR